MVTLLAGFLFAWTFPTLPALRTTPGEFPRVSPAAVGMSSESLRAVDQVVQSAIDSQWIAGAVSLVAKDGQIAYENAWGMRDIASGDSLAIDDLFRMASMTKPITSLAILQLFEQGKLDFQDPVSKYIPEFSQAKILRDVDLTDSTWQGTTAPTPITIHHLLTHTSGIAYGFSDTMMSRIYTKAGIVELSTLKPLLLQENIAKLARLPLKHNPGVAWTYGLSTDVLGRVVEVASGMPFDQYLQQHIFAPLGMDNTGFYFEADDSTRLSTLYSNHPEYKLVPFPDYPERNLTGNFPITGAKTYFSGGAGLVSTAHDYLRFCQAVLNGGELHGTRIIREETLQHMKENKIGDLRVGKSFFSYGFSISTPEEAGHLGQKAGRLGWGGVFQTTFWIDQERNSIAILLTQVLPSYHQEKIYSSFEQAVNAAYLN